MSGAPKEKLSDLAPAVAPPTELGHALQQVHAYLRKFVAFPDPHAAVAATLWVGHAHRVQDFDSTPRLAFLSPEPGSGKTRALEVIGVLVPHPMHAVNATPAALFRAVSDLDARPTILFDEIDTVFGPKAKDNEEVRGFLNAGHRRSGVAYRCVGIGTAQKVVAFPAFCAVAVAGLNDVPDTIGTRAVIVRMRRRKPGEVVEPFRPRINEPEGHAIADRLGKALQPLRLPLDPKLPTGVTDRPADVWEPLLSVAQAAGGDWPALAAEACKAFVFRADDRAPSLRLLLLADLRSVFDGDAMHTEDLLTALRGIEESPWSDLKGKPLDSRRLSGLLSGYEVRPKDVKLAGITKRGYRREDLYDAWERYLPPAPAASATSATSATGSGSGGAGSGQVALETTLPLPPKPALTRVNASRVVEVAEVADLRRPAGGEVADTAPASATRPPASATCLPPGPPVRGQQALQGQQAGPGVALVALVADGPGDRGAPASATCRACGEPMTADFFGDGLHPNCAPAQGSDS